MSTIPTPNSRASLLSGLRTGGVRSTSSTVPHTAAIGGSFGLNRFSAQPQHQEEDDHVLDLPSQNAFANLHHGGNRVMPMTAAVDGPNNSFIQQQRGLNPASVPFSPGFNNLPQSAQAQNQAFQMQMMQLEILKMQAIQAQQAQQQYQAELLAQAQRQQEQQAQVQNKPRLSYNPPATAGPAVNAFDLRSATLSAQMRRANQEQAKSHLSVGGDGHVPMTAALGGRFGARAISLNGLPPMQFNPEIGQEAPPVLPHTPNSTTVISGGTSLGSPAPNNLTFINTAAPSKSDSASSWRRGGQNNSVLRGLRSATSPSVRITPPPLSEQVSSDIPPDSATPSTASTVTPSTATGPKFRPQPLRFSMAVSQPMPSVLAVDTTETNEAADLDDSSSNASSTKSHSTSPTSASSAELSPREEASKKLYEGLGIGRPRSAVSNGSAVSLNEGVSIPTRIVSQPMRHPKGPPSGADELGPQNFATRIRRKAIGGLGVLIDARERREVVAY